MSSQRFPECVDSSAHLQIWNNAAFDNGDGFSESHQSWGSLKSIFENPRASTDSVCGKENKSPGLENQIVSGTVIPFKEKSEVRVVLGNTIVETVDESALDEEIHEIESEIQRLTTRLESLKMEKTEMRLKARETKERGRVSVVDEKSKLKNREELTVGIRNQDLRRGMSLGPCEILAAGRRRGRNSIGPSEIFKPRQDMITPLQDRRKSCFFKIDEEKVMARPGTGVWPKSNAVIPRHAVTTVTKTRNAKKDYGLLNTIQPKKLFGERSVNKKPGRVVASRYNQTPAQASTIRKRSLTDNNSNKTCEKKRSLLQGNDLGTASRVKKRWEIPSEIVLHDSSLEFDKDKSPSIVSIPDLLPRLKIAHCLKESPRDSGPAKRATELIGRKSFFAIDEEEPSLCQALTYPEEEE